LYLEVVGPLGLEPSPPD